MSMEKWCAGSAAGAKRVNKEVETEATNSCCAGLVCPPLMEPAPAPEPQPAPSTGEISYTYKAGDTFGQVVTNLGLKTRHGLWGADGDVAYYTEQLHQQGIYGNIPIGATIKLTPRTD